MTPPGRKRRFQLVQVPIHNNGLGLIGWATMIYRTHPAFWWSSQAIHPTQPVGRYNEESGCFPYVAPSFQPLSARDGPVAHEGPAVRPRRLPELASTVQIVDPGNLGRKISGELKTIEFPYAIAFGFPIIHGWMVPATEIPAGVWWRHNPV